jgi:putative IMPACT (imprinted ancient) family translation regulator
MEELAAVKLVVRRSRFFAHLYRIETQNEISDIIRLHRQRYKKARHHCYAVRITGSVNSDILENWKDDGEIAHPGRILLDILKRHQLTSHILVVSRIFGGIKLGAGGVGRAFREAGEEVINCYSAGKKLF